jgi:hypothetical protein
MKTGGSQVTHGTDQYNWVKLTLDDAPLLVLSGGYFLKPAGSFDVFPLFFRF